MIDKSGYGKMRDTYIRLSHDDSYYLPICDFKHELGISDYIYHNYLALQEDIKSKYVLADKYEDPIIASKAISLKKTINDYTTIKESQGDADSEVNYTFHESNIYPCHNHDLLDVYHGLNTSALDHKKSIFHDKLIMYNNNISFPYMNYGPLYNISPENTPVLTQVIPINKDNNKNNILKITLNKENLMDVLEMKHIVHATKKSRSVAIGMYDIFYIIYHIKEHFRNINSSDVIPIEAYIPNCIATIKIVIAKKTIQRLLTKFTVNSELANQYNNPIGTIDKMLMCSVLNYDFKCYLLWDLINNRDKKSNSSIDEYISRPASLSEENYIKKLKMVQFIRFPFGNVYDSFVVCNQHYKMTEWALDINHLIKNSNVLDLAFMINGSYSDFFDSKFNHDLLRMNFILKDDYLRFLEFKNSFNSKEEYEEQLKKYSAQIPF